MSVEPSFGTLEAEQLPPEPPRQDMAFRIGVLGDFSGRANRGVNESGDLAGRRPHPINPENFDDVLARLGVALTLPLGEDGDPVELEFSSLDDFHPDPLFEKVERFEDLDSEEQTALMNALLHHPDFQALEAAWRGLDWLLRRVHKESPVEVVLLDVSRDEFAADLRAGDDLAACGLYQLLIEKMTQGAKGKPWAVLAGHYTFGLSLPDAELLGRMARIARQAAAPFLAAAPTAVFDKSFALDEDTTEAWTALRNLPEANMLGLLVPRFLLRQPYGEGGRAIERFSYAEFATAPRQEVYLWGNPAVACAALLGQSFLQKGWGFKPGMVVDLRDMPLHVYVEDGDSESTLTELWLTTTSSQRAAKLGLMTLLPVRGRDCIQLARFQALATGATTLPGRWEQGAGVPRAASTKSPPVTVSINPAGSPVPAAPAAPPQESAGSAEEAPSSPEETPPSEFGTETAAAETSGAAGMDPELAALMNQLEGATSTEEPAADAGGGATETAASDAGMDPELAALMKQLEGGTSSETPSETPSEPAAEGGTAEMDPELAKLLKELEGG